MKRFLLFSMAVMTLVASMSIFSGAAFGTSPSEPMILKLAHYVPPSSFLGQQTQWWADQVEKRTGGKVKIRIFWMQSLVKMPDMLKAVQNGIADLAWIPSTYWPSNFPLYMMMDNPGNCVESYEAAILAGIDTTDNEPHLKAELERENVFPVIPYESGLGVLGVRKCYDSFLDIKGKTIRVYGSGQTKYIEALGGNPVFMPYSDIYEAVDRGTVGGAIMVLPLSDGFKHYEIIKCVYQVNMGQAVACGFAMSQKAFFKLPQDMQKTILDLRRDYAIRYAKMLKELEDSLYDQWANKHGVTMKVLTPEEAKANQEAIEKSTKEMIKAQESSGHKDAQAVWDYYLAAQRKIMAQGKN